MSYLLRVSLVHETALVPCTLADLLLLRGEVDRILYQDLEVPTIMRNQMGEAAWSPITYEEFVHAN